MREGSKGKSCGKILTLTIMLKYSLGIDISKSDLHACISVIDAQQLVKVKSTRKFANTQKGFEELHLWRAKHHREKDVPLSVTMEATGVYFESCALYLFRKGYTIAVILPNKAKQYLRAIGLKTKNDKIDAAGLARMGAEQRLDKWEPLADFFFTLRSLTRHHQSLQELKTNIANQLHADQHSIYGNKAVIKQLKGLVSTLEKQIEETEKGIGKHIESNPEVAGKVKKILSVKGIGILTIATILAETNGFTLFKSISQLVSYAGYDVIENQSGKHNGKTRISKRGNGRIRRALNFPAFNVVRYDVGPFKPFFDRILEKHNQKMKAYVAVQRKVLILIYVLWKKNEVFSPSPTVDKNENISNIREVGNSSVLAQIGQTNSPGLTGLD